LWLSSVVASAITAPHLPGVVPVHWNFRGQPDRWGSKYELLLAGPAVLLLLGLLVVVSERVDPRLRSEDDPRPRQEVSLLALGLMAALHVVLLAHSAGVLADPTSAMALALSAFCVLMGNVLTRIRPNSFAGIRTPWTLTSDEVWRATHRLGGRLIFASGLAGAVAALVARGPVALVVITAGLLGASLVSVVYSYLFHRKGQAD
jgi:uncharacterized membrane protein